jgi:glycosyltransferase involved in cell wall biosynthesis
VRELSPWKDLKAYFRLKRYFKENRFDVVHTHSSKAGIIGRYAARAAHVPVVVHTVHGQAFHPHEKWYRNFLYILLERLAARKCDRIYAVAQAMIDQCVAAKVAKREKYKVVYSGMETQRFASATRDMELRRRLGIPEDARTIVTVARLFPLKGYEFVLPAAKRVIEKYPDTHLLVVGDGPMHDELAAKIADDGLSEHFHFAGLVPPDTVAEYLAQGELLWHLSLREGLPRAVVQSLACGIPAVGFALDGTPEVLENGVTGFAVTPESVDAVVEATELIWNDDALRRKMGEQGKRRVLERFDWRRMADILLAEYRELYRRR